MVGKVVGALPRVNYASKNLIIVSGLKKQNPINTKDTLFFKLKDGDLQCSYNVFQKSSPVARSFQVTDKIKDVKAIRKVINFFQNQKFDLIDISENQRVTKEAFTSAKGHFTSTLNAMLEPKFLSPPKQKPSYISHSA